MVTWVLVAGVIALWRRSAAVGVLIGGWLACFIVLKASSPSVNVSDGSFFRYMIPAFPAFFFGLVALPLLVPVFGRRLAAAGARAGVLAREPARVRRSCSRSPRPRSSLPIARDRRAAPARGADARRASRSSTSTSPANTFPLTATARPGGGVVLRWPSQDASGARAGYAIFREPGRARVHAARHAAAAATSSPTRARRSS